MCRSFRAARELFVELGYRNVSMAQIAERVGITAGALYRHFSNKSVLLDAVIWASFDELTPAFEPTASLADALAESCEKVVARRDVGTLWWRESRNLPEDLRTPLRDRLRAVNGQYADRIRAQRPTLSESSAVALAWGVQSILASVSSHSSKDRRWRIREPAYRRMRGIVRRGVVALSGGARAPSDGT